MVLEEELERTPLPRGFEHRRSLRLKGPPVQQIRKATLPAVAALVFGLAALVSPAGASVSRLAPVEAPEGLVAASNTVVSIPGRQVLFISFISRKAQFGNASAPRVAVPQLSDAALD
jgi:hypothetical protein